MLPTNSPYQAGLLPEQDTISQRCYQPIHFPEWASTSYTCMSKNIRTEVQCWKIWSNKFLTMQSWTPLRLTTICFTKNCRLLQLEYPLKLPKLTMTWPASQISAYKSVFAARVASVAANLQVALNNWPHYKIAASLAVNIALSSLHPVNLRVLAKPALPSLYQPASPATRPTLTAAVRSDQGHDDSSNVFYLRLEVQVTCAASCAWNELGRLEQVTSGVEPSQFWGHIQKVA